MTKMEIVGNMYKAGLLDKVSPKGLAFIREFRFFGR